MNKLITSFIVFLLVLGCSKDEVDGNSLAGTWKVISFQNVTSGTLEFKNAENSWDKDITVTFDVASSPKSISGTNISNEISGDLTLAAADKFRVTNLASTYVAQPSWADEFSKAIQDQNLTYEIINDTLVIYYQQKSKVVTLVRV